LSFYPKSFIEEMNQQTPIAELMKEEGESIYGRGRTLSFYCTKCNGDLENSKINTEHNFFKCYRCENLGSPFQGKPVNYLQQQHGYTLQHAVEYLANRNGTPLPEPILSKEEKERLHAYRLTMRFYEQHWNDSQYLVNRGVSEKLIKKYRIGYAPGGKALRNHLEEKGLTLEKQIIYNLVTSAGIDRFFNRLIVPLTRNQFPYDFYTRDINAESRLKHLPLRGEFMAFGQDTIQKNCDYLDLYESVINKLVAETNGYPNGLAIGGCNKFSLAHLQLIKAINPKCIRIIFDADLQGQGQKAALKVAQMLVSAGFKVLIVLLPMGRDTADLLSSGDREIFEKALYHAFEFEVFRAHFLMMSMPINIIEQHLQWRNDQCFPSSQNQILDGFSFWSSSQ